MATSMIQLPPQPDLRAMRDDELTLGAIASILRRQRVVLFWVFGSVLAIVTLYVTFATRRYEATGVVQIQKDSSGAFGLENSVMGDAADSASDALDYNITLQTEANILTSDSLALRVIHDLHLETTEDFYPPSKTIKKSMLPAGLTFWKSQVESMNIPLDRAPNRRYAVLKTFASHLKVEPVTGTRLIEVKYRSPDPELSAAVVNHLISALMDYSFQARYSATSQASNWLTAQLEDLRKETENLQSRAVTLQRDTGMFGDDESHNVVLARLENLNQALAAAESNRILKEAVYHVASSGDPELISGLSGNMGFAATPSMTNSLGLIQNLRAQQATVQAEFDQDRVKYGSSYPRIAELQAELKGVEQSIHDEVHRIGERAHTDYQIAEQAEKSARDSFEQQKKLANALNDKAIAYGLAKQEADGSRDVYEGLLSKLKEAGVLEGLHSTNITVVNPARVPSRNHPRSPNLLLYYAAAILAGLIFGSSAAVYRDLNNTRVQSFEELELHTGLPLLGLIPAIEGSGSKRFRLTAVKGEDKNALLSYLDNPFMESLRTLRTSLLLSRSGSAPQVILITSSGAGEGKSTVSLNLATVLAQQGSRVLLVDADLRRPVLHERVGLHGDHGLSTVLSDSRIDPKPYQVERIPTLHVLCGGPVPPFPAELLGSKRMQMLLAQWRNEFDFIVLDGPPTLAVTDAILLAQECDATLLVARHGLTEKKAVKRAHQTLFRHMPQHAVLGAVLNAVPSSSNEFYEYYGYRSEIQKSKRQTHVAQA